MLRVLRLTVAALSRLPTRLVAEEVEIPIGINDVVAVVVVVVMVAARVILLPVVPLGLPAVRRVPRRQVGPRAAVLEVVGLAIAVPALGGLGPGGRGAGAAVRVREGLERGLLDGPPRLGRRARRRGCASAVLVPFPAPLRPRGVDGVPVDHRVFQRHALPDAQRVLLLLRLLLRLAVVRGADLAVGAAGGGAAPLRPGRRLPFALALALALDGPRAPADGLGEVVRECPAGTSRPRGGAVSLLSRPLALPLVMACCGRLRRSWGWGAKAYGAFVGMERSAGCDGRGEVHDSVRGCVVVVCR